MKRYIVMTVVVALTSCSFVFCPPTIAPVTEGEYSIVNAIERYSNLTEADVNQYKLLMLGSLDTVGAFIAGAVSTIGVGVGVYQQSGAIQSITPDRVPGWMTSSLILAGLGSASAGLVSYKLLYPRIRAGVLDKVQRFIDVCQALNEATPRYPNDYRTFSIVNWSFRDFYLLQSYLPNSWPRGDNVAVYNALYNLNKQASRAKLLLNQIQNDDEVDQKRTIINDYIVHLSANVHLYESAINRENTRQRQQVEADKNAIKQEQRDDLQLAEMQANVNLKEAGTGLAKAKIIQTYGQMAADTLRGASDMFNYLYKNKEKIVYRASILSGAAYGGYVYLKNRLGYPE